MTISSHFQAPESHAVRKEVIRQIAVPDQQQPRRRRKLEVKGDVPLKIGQDNQIKNLIEGTTATQNALQPSKPDPSKATHNAIPRKRTETTTTTHYNTFPRGRPETTTTATHNSLLRSGTEKTNTTHNAFPRSRTNLSSAAKRGTKRYVRQFSIKSNASSASSVNLLETSNGFFLNFDKNCDNSRTLPYIKLQQSVTDYKTYKQNSSPFARTLI